MDLSSDNAFLRLETILDVLSAVTGGGVDVEGVGGDVAVEYGLGTGVRDRRGVEEREAD